MWKYDWTTCLHQSSIFFDCFFVKIYMILSKVQILKNLKKIWLKLYIRILFFEKLKKKNIKILGSKFDILILYIISKIGFMFNYTSMILNNQLISNRYWCIFHQWSWIINLFLIDTDVFFINDWYIFINDFNDWYIFHQWLIYFYQWLIYF